MWLCAPYSRKNPKLISNEDIIDYYVDKALEIVHFEGDLKQGAQAFLFFEAVLEDIEVKAHVFRMLAAENPNPRHIFSNTSSIPIHVLQEKSKLNNTIIGFHFYNPPAIQKLIEIIPPEGVDPELESWANELAGRLHKKTVYSKDVAGFIGNGFFIRELLFGFRQAHELAQEFTLPVALNLINRITHDFLVRPMGLFQLMDYVGIDVCQHICATMKAYLPDASLQEPFIDRLIAAGIIGGQHANGSQKEGLFRYENQQPVAVYSLEANDYIPIDKGDQILGMLPEGHFFLEAAAQRSPERKKVTKITSTTYLKSKRVAQKLPKYF